MSILDRQPGGDPTLLQAESDIIVTSIALGFCATRLLQGQPVRFDIAPAESNYESAHIRICQSIQFVLNYNKIEGEIDSGFTPQFPELRLITGYPGGHTQPFDNRHMPMRSPRALKTARSETDSPSTYSGRGAYTGMIDDPIRHHTFVQATRRMVVLPGQGRWIPEGEYPGLIKPPQSPKSNLSTDRTEGMGPVSPKHHCLLGCTQGSGDGENSLAERGIIGYVHGMSWAMREAIKYGPWCTPYELAIGNQTHKLASCFPCTLYMYAAGFPPSSIHLGRGESWIPLPPNDGDNTDKHITKLMNDRWVLECMHYMQLGVRCLNRVALSTVPNAYAYVTMSQQARKTHTSQMNPQKKLYMDQITQLKEMLFHHTSVPLASTLFLDALTIHDFETSRIQRTLDITGQS